MSTPGLPTAITPAWIAIAKDSLAALQSLLTAGALIAAAWWFFTGRQDQTRIRIEQSISHRVDPDDAAYNVIAVDVRVTNTANVLVNLNQGFIDIDKIATPSKSLFHQKVQGFHLEPNETEQVWFQVFRLPANVRTIQIYSKFQTPDPHFFWHLASAFDTFDTEQKTQKSVSE